MSRKNEPPNNAPREKSIKKFTGKHALIWFVGFFLIIFTVNAIMATIAIGTWGGLETNNAYRKGIHYNEEIAAAEKQKESGWQVSLDHTPTSLVGDHLDVLVTWPKGDLPPESISALVTRAVTNAHDQEITLTKRGEDDIYTAPVTLPFYGQWDINILVKRNKNTIYQIKEKIFVKAGK